MRPVPPPALIAFGGLKCMRSRRGAARSVAAPFPARHARPAAAAAGGRPRPLPRAGASPRLLPPSLRVLVAPSARKGSFLRPLAALALRSASRPFAPPLPSLARGSGALWGVLAPLRLGLALASGGVAGAPLPRPPSGGFARSRSPAGAPAGAACAAPFGASVAPAGFGLVLPPLRRRRVCVFLFRRVAGLWAGAALLCSCARSMLHQACACCPHSRCLTWARVSPPENINNALSERTLRKRYAAPLPYLHKRFSA